MICPICKTEVNGIRGKNKHIKEKNHKQMMKHCRDYLIIIPNFLVKEYIETLKFEKLH